MATLKNEPQLKIKNLHIWHTTHLGAERALHLYTITPYEVTRLDFEAENLHSANLTIFFNAQR